MRSWPADHPKAKLLRRKREAILAAARRQFLAHGYGGTSMEAVAAEAGVSIMTLYRHAERKDELFAAVISIACNPEEEAAFAEDLAGKPLEDVLVASALAFEAKLTSAETMALLRAVIAEHGRFPDLAAAAFRAAIGHIAVVVEAMLAAAPEARGLGAAERERLAARFADALLGADVLRILLGLEPEARPNRARAERATAEVMEGLRAGAIATA